MKKTHVAELFALLHKAYEDSGSLPFWGWNADLADGELNEQLRGFRQQHFSGFFIHSREGLETPYLSDEWLKKVNQTLAEAKRLDLNAWIYDEDTWPSGMVGGVITSKSPELAAHALTLEITAVDSMLEEAENCFVFPELLIDDETILEPDAEKHVQLEAQGKEAFGKKLVLRVETSNPAAWYNDNPPADMLNPQTTADFISLTHEKYWSCLDAVNRAAVRGFFTDEPNFCDFFSSFTEKRPWLPWTIDLLEQFQLRRGYPLQQKLPLLFFKGEGYQKIRHDYWWTLTELFSERYAARLYQWCQAHGVESTGHFLFENDLGYAVRVCGAVMPHYRYLHMPGIDLLGEQIEEYLTVRQCTSVAHQYGKPKVVTETYGCTGWDFSFEGQKWLADWQFVQGVTTRCQHLVQYSLKGCRKRDYPPSFNYHTTWWPYTSIIEDYCAELSVFTTAGNVKRDILIIHPSTGIWTQMGSSPKENLHDFDSDMGWTDPRITAFNKVGAELNRLCKQLMGAHIDFDLGDEIILKELGKVENSRCVVGEASYSIIVIPSTYSLFASTLVLLEAFIAGGGSVIWITPFPELVEGVPQKKLIQQITASCVTTDRASFLPVLEQLYEKSVSVFTPEYREASDIFLMERDLEDGKVLIFVNSDRDRGYDTIIRYKGFGYVEQYSLLSHERSAIPVNFDGIYISFEHTFKAADSFICIIHRDRIPLLVENIEFPYRHPHASLPVTICLHTPDTVTPTEENVFVLDTCRYYLEGEAASERMPVWKAQEQLRSKLGFRNITGNGMGQRYAWLPAVDTARVVPVNIVFSFFIEDLPETEIYICSETLAESQIAVNGICMEKTEFGYFHDRSCKTLVMSGLKIGWNEVIVTVAYSESTELEDHFILGDFAVTNQGAITVGLQKILLGNAGLQGYPFYAGSLRYSFSFEIKEEILRSYILHIGAWKGTLALLTINETEQLPVPWHAVNDFDISPYLQVGKNILTIEIVGSLRNMLGPIRQPYQDKRRISWQDFRTRGSLYASDPVLVEFGLFEALLLYSS